MLTIEQIKDTTKEVVSKYPVKKVSVFGSYARGRASDNSDMDFLVEFISSDVSLYLISEIKSELGSKLQRSVDLVHAPVEENSLLVIDEVIDIYEHSLKMTDVWVTLTEDIPGLKMQLEDL